MGKALLASYLVHRQVLFTSPVLGGGLVFNFITLYHDTSHVTVSAIPYLFGYKTGFPLSRMTTNNHISPICSFAIIQVLPFLNTPKHLDPSYKMDLDVWDCFGRKRTLSYNRRNMVYYH